MQARYGPLASLSTNYTGSNGIRTTQHHPVAPESILTLYIPIRYWLRVARVLAGSYNASHSFASVFGPEIKDSSPGTMETPDDGNQPNWGR